MCSYIKMFLWFKGKNEQLREMLTSIERTFFVIGITL